MDWRCAADGGRRRLRTSRPPTSWHARRIRRSTLKARHAHHRADSQARLTVLLSTPAPASARSLEQIPTALEAPKASRSSSLAALKPEAGAERQSARAERFRGAIDGAERVVVNGPADERPVPGPNCTRSSGVFKSFGTEALADVGMTRSRRNPCSLGRERHGANRR